MLVGLAWGLTTPFIRAAARSHRPPPHPLLDSPRVRASWLRARLLRAFFAGRRGAAASERGIAEVTRLMYDMAMNVVARASRGPG